MQILAIRLQNRQDSIFNDEIDSDRKSYPFELKIFWTLMYNQVGTGERSEKNRTYNYPNVRLASCLNCRVVLLIIVLG